MCLLCFYFCSSLAIRVTKTKIKAVLWRKKSTQMIQNSIILSHAVKKINVGLVKKARVKGISLGSMSRVVGEGVRFPIFQFSPIADD